MVATITAVTGGATSPFRYWMVMPIAGLMTRYSRRVVVLGLLLIFSTLIGVIFAFSARAVVANPYLVMEPVALTAATGAMCWALMKSETTQRAERVVDQLTGLLNRKALDDHATVAAHQASVTGTPVSLLRCDLDHFKQINDGYGHAIGDAVLKQAAYALRSTLRAFDTAYRIGGEEFMLLLPGVETAEVRPRSPSGSARRSSAPARPVSA